MSRSFRSIAVGLVLFSVSVLSACGGGAAKPAPGMGCALNSDCAAGLTCTFGLCHSACVVNGDCPTGELCVKSGATGDGGSSLNVCQLAVESKCVYNSDCTPLVCARDEQCRNECQTSADCVSPQVCTDSKVCALPSQLVAGTNDVKVVTTGLDGGSAGAGGSGAAGTGGSGGGTPTGAGGAAGAAGTTGTAGTTGKGGTTGTAGTTGAGGAAGSAGGCSPACGLGSQCVSGTCQPCGVSGAICCGTGSTATCQSNLTCVSGSCTCGAVSEACCSGTTCNTGLQCVGGVVCSCGGAGQNCCSGKTCNAGLVCGGIRCGCATACDESAVLKNDGSIFVNSTPITNLDDTLFKVTTFSYNGTIGCGVKADGTVWCWGTNTYGALGIGDTTVASSTTPVQVLTAAGGSPLSGITSVAVGDSGYTGCAIGAGGAVWCWGYGGYGQLGNGFKNNSSFATPVLTDASATQFTGAQTISMSYVHACVYKTDKTVWCWGDNTYGEAGVGSTATTILYPAQVTNLQTLALDVIASDEPYANSCAATSDGSAYCWGGNTYEDLGNGLMSGMAIVPTQVLTAAATPLTQVTSVVDWISGYKLCAQRSDLSVWCWGGGTTAGLYATPLVDGQSNPVSGETVIGRECYLDANDKLWVAGSMSGNQVTCP